MKLIEDLGRQKPTEKSLYYKTYGIYECECGVHFKVAHSAVKIGRIQWCKKCGMDKRPTTCKVDYIRKLALTHSNKYDYSKVVYWSVRDDVTIICPIHGEFTQSLKSHRVGNGCPHCGSESRSIVLRKVMDKRPCTLYYVLFEDYNLYKVGVSHNLAERFRGEPLKPKVIDTINYPTGIQAYYVEELLKRIHIDINYKGPKVLHRKGNTELYTHPIDFRTSVETIEDTEEYKELIRKLVE